MKKIVCIEMSLVPFHSFLFAAYGRTIKTAQKGRKILQKKEERRPCRPRPTQDTARLGKEEEEEEGAPTEFQEKGEEEDGALRLRTTDQFCQGSRERRTCMYVRVRGGAQSHLLGSLFFRVCGINWCCGRHRSGISVKNGREGETSRVACCLLENILLLVFFKCS